MAMSVTDNNTLTLLNTMDYLSAQQGAIFRRLCTGSKINRGADDPAGLMALQSINCELIGVDAAIRNNQRSDAMLNVADSALTQLSDLLGQIQTLVAQSSNSAGLTANEIASNQSQIDDAIASIERIVRTTEFNGRNLLDGSLGINVTGANATYFENVRVYSRDPSAASNAVRVTVNGVAQRAKAEGLTTTAASQATTIEVKGRLGTQIIDLKADENLSAVVAKINDVTALTGVYASGTSAGVDLYSKGYGSAEFVKVSILSGDTTHFKELDGAGVDADVTVNGAAASADGNEVYFSQNGLNLAFRITEAFTAGTTQTFEVDKTGGATFQLGTDATTRYTLGIDSLSPRRLGGKSAGGFLSDLKSGGAASLAKNPAAAAAIAADAQKQVATMQGRIGSFQKYQIEISKNTMAAIKESLTTVKSSIADVDYAQETAALARQDVLMQSVASMLSVASQQSAQRILSLL
ncbi:MAG TPA: flagellin [Phycisphaerae bacterium]|nr:flagellin [Phycisphaerae bacterium]HPC20979.1 flagellin [Phycisphaerae bacterium]HRS27144.1 flagellin [Phycisphaerae bacterium]HRT40654.1 flagellin [Phycisphaerae bacterium]